MYKTRMASDFFTFQGLETRTGLSRRDWTLALVKELIDNALDAIEEASPKEVAIDYRNNTLKVFDNGSGLSITDIEAIYDFDNYATTNRHFINISRGKQGNGLKSIIGICQLNRCRLLWHTNEGAIICPQIDTDNAQDGEIFAVFNRLDDSTNCRGVEIQGINISIDFLGIVIRQFAECNRDVLFSCGDYRIEPTEEPLNRQGETSLLFYDVKEYMKLLSVQAKDTYYKTFLGDVFGTRIKNESAIKGKISDLNMNEVEDDFYNLQAIQGKKPLTLLRRHIIGYKNILEQYPYIIEFEAIRQESPGACVMVNNSITYRDAASISIPHVSYPITPSKKIWANHLAEIVSAFEHYFFNIHIITPRPEFRDYGKTRIDIGAIACDLVDEMRKVVNREKRNAPKADKSKSKKDLAFEYMDKAFALASSDGKYSITARQMYYKLRELICDQEWETSSTYNDFTQNWLTEWLDDNPGRENKVNFSDRGTFIVDGKGTGLGSASVDSFIIGNKSRANRLTIDASISIKYLTDFDICYRYDKALYIEKTGFNEIFISEDIQEKYNALIVSGQGFASRSARRLLFDLQQKGLKIYCMHDLDIYGVNIYRSMCVANDKFKHDIDIVDLGITPADVARYGIKPERVALSGKDEKTISRLPNEHASFFWPDADGDTRRVELNAFTTEQLLQIIDDKLRNTNSLPKLDISTAIKADLTKIKEYALFKLVRSKYAEMLSGITLDDLPTGSMTYHELMAQMPGIKDKIISKLSAQIERAM